MMSGDHDITSEAGCADSSAEIEERARRDQLRRVQRAIRSAANSAKKCAEIHLSAEHVAYVLDRLFTKERLVQASERSRDEMLYVRSLVEAAVGSANRGDVCLLLPLVIAEPLAFVLTNAEDYGNGIGGSLRFLASADVEPAHAVGRAFEEAVYSKPLVETSDTTSDGGVQAWIADDDFRLSEYVRDAGWRLARQEVLGDRR